MKLTLMLAALIAIPLAGRGSATLHDQQGSRVPPPPPLPAINDPVPGPFRVRLNEQGQVASDQLGVITNAVNLWSGPTPQAFAICFRPGADGVGSSGINALREVTRELKARGARLVVTPSGGACLPSSPGPNWKGAHVEIMGVVSLE